MNQSNEIIRLTPFELNGKRMVDMRWWKNTAKGPHPTKRGIAMDQSMVTRLIWGLQKYHAKYSSEEAREKSLIEG
jgi:hypothetical protein